MISFELSEEQKIVQSTMSEFAKNVLRPEARKSDDNAKLDDEVLAALWSTGLVQSQADEDEGGSSVTNAIVLEELAAGDAAMAVSLAASLGFAQAIATQGSPAQRELLATFAAGEINQGAIALVERGSGNDLLKPSTTAKRSGDGYTLNGVKTMVPMAANCSHFLVIADNEGALDAFIVPADTAGVRVEQSPATLGLRAAQLGQVSFNDVKLSGAMRLGEGNGADIQKIVDSARVGLTAIMVGVSRAVMDYVIPYTKERHVHGVKLAQKQTIAFNIADMHMGIECMRGMTWNAAWELEARRPATRSAQLAYTYASQQAMQIADNGVQAMGGHGFVKAHPMEMWYRNARALSVLEGAIGV
ncbi:MAG: acyl-CoA dehydrogenase family protein [Phenylobacterium sp.]|uniref:acyl-CoA dehydrogenase family protein n=1 Tax=Phenylobacterium sp. TaxID=1871053 RepID=UPI0027325CBA|nr:acyl-CoA dehydrogenase family protein [Phenylobacterium sp.]MDP3173870.1 acyl-CoA dehydrogenase family protein [Phenylobacterium sp.]